MISACRINRVRPAEGRRAGFTLIELLVAISISALILLILVQVISRSLQVSRRSTDNMQAFSGASAALDLIASDLTSLAPTRQPYTYLQALPDPRFPDANHGSLFAGTTQPMMLMFNAVSVQDSAQSTGTGTSLAYPDSGQTRTVCYRIAWQNPVVGGTGTNPAPPTTASTGVFGLYRQVVSSALTFQKVLGYTTNGTNPNLYVSLFNNNNGYSGPAVPPAVSEFVVGNVVDLQVALYAPPLPASGVAPQPTAAVVINPPPSTSGTTTTSPYCDVQVSGSRTTYTTSTDPTSSGTSLATSGNGYGKVTTAEISVTVLEQAGATLWGDGTGTGALSPATLKQQYGHTLTRQVVLNLAR